MSNLVTTALDWLADKSRAASLLVVSLVLIAVVALIAPQQIGIVAYKGALLSAAAFAGYWIDRALFPYSRPHDVYHDSHAEYRRAIIVSACVLAGALSA